LSEREGEFVRASGFMGSGMGSRESCIGNDKSDSVNRHK
jgi:hypothetical protein